jgi:hypothetical protein
MNTGGFVSQEVSEEIIRKIKASEGYYLPKEVAEKLQKIDFNKLVEIISENLENKINRQSFEQFNWLLPNNMTYEKYLDFIDKFKDDYEE